jgi:hypothetical protein
MNMFELTGQQPGRREGDRRQVEGADDRAPQPRGQGIDRVETGGKSLSSETGPAARGHGEVCLDGRLAASVTVEARSFFGLQLEELQYPHGFAGGGHDPQFAVGLGQHEPGRADTEQSQYIPEIH